MCRHGSPCMNCVGQRLHSPGATVCLRGRGVLRGAQGGALPGARDGRRGQRCRMSGPSAAREGGTVRGGGVVLGPARPLGYALGLLVGRRTGGSGNSRLPGSVAVGGLGRGDGCPREGAGHSEGRRRQFCLARGVSGGHRHTRGESPAPPGRRACGAGAAGQGREAGTRTAAATVRTARSTVASVASVECCSESWTKAVAPRRLPT